VNDLQARRVKERGLRVLRVKRPAAHIAAARAPHDDGGGEARAVARRRDIIREHVVGARHKVDELHLCHRPHAHVRRAGRRSDDRGFGDRRVDHALGAEPLREAFRDLERAAVQAHVLPQNEDAVVALHLLPQPLAQRLVIGDFGHQRLRIQRRSAARGFACTPAPPRARSTASFVAWYTASTSLPSTVAAAMPYPFALSAKSLTANCCSGGVEYAQRLYSAITTRGHRCTAAKFSPSWNVPVE